MITVQNATIYSAQGETAYQVDYSDGTQVRAVESTGNIIRKEYKHRGEWKMVGKPYVVKHSKVRAAEVLKKMAQEFLAA